MILAVGIVKLVRVAEHGQNAYEVGFQDGFLHHIAYLVSGGIGSTSARTSSRFRTSSGGSSATLSALLTRPLRPRRGCSRSDTSGGSGRGIRVRLPAVVTGAIPWE